MNKWLTILFLIAAEHGYGSAFSADTIDNWQIYHGGELLVAGIASSSGTGTIKQKDLKDIEIVYNHCGQYRDLGVTIEITDELNKKLLVKDLRVDSGDRMIIRKEELRALSGKSLKIRYRERRPNGVDVLLARIEMI